MNRLVTVFFLILVATTVVGFMACRSKVGQQQQAQPVLEQPTQVNETPPIMVRQENVKRALRTVAQYGHSSEITSIAFSPDGSLLASGSGLREGTVKIWRISDGALLATLEGRPVFAVAFSPDGGILAVGNGDYLFGGDGKVELWKIPDWSLIRVLETKEGSVRSISFSPDGTIVASRGDKTSRTSGLPPDPSLIEYPQIYNLWKVSNGSLLKACDSGCLPKQWGRWSGKTAYSPDGSVLASASKDGIKLSKVSDKSLIRTLGGYGGAAISVGLSPDGKILACGHEDGTVSVFNLFDGSLIRTLKGHKKGVFSVAIVKKIASASTQDYILISISVEKHGERYSYNSVTGVEYEGDEVLVNLWNVPTGSLIGARTGSSKDNDRTLAAFIWAEAGAVLWSDWRVNGQKSTSYATTDDGKRGVFINNGAVEIRPAKSTIPLITLFVLDANTTAALTPEGFFSGTGDIDRYVHFVSGLEVYHFNQFYDAFYRPDLVKKKFKGEDISKYAGGLNIENALRNPPPQAAILSPQDGVSTDQRKVAVKIRITDTGGKIGDIRLYHNGKLVESSGVYRLAEEENTSEPIQVAYATDDKLYGTARGTVLRGVSVKEKKSELSNFTPLSGVIEKTYGITLVNGGNTISASAFNGENTVMSALQTIKVRADLPSAVPDLFGLAIGNDHFKDSSQNLTLAIKDAASFIVSATLRRNSDDIA